ncbi:HEAT repeat-containing protein [Tieghemostelium lacteum]|uniref:HEAT repeat-containing protein n=1 Tax=Tieghemostelium lacteum TaxID=361077 RepID=A0A151Z2S3_TIELA|nr:HEAT repeat-containing protein [Tieghemostelium lacteum]|eukprot:KYQ88256.1 HEAT repeat-containing protein [Tieghemostelium lacteum]
MSNEIDTTQQQQQESHGDQFNQQLIDIERQLNASLSDRKQAFSQINEIVMNSIFDQENLAVYQTLVDFYFQIFKVYTNSDSVHLIVESFSKFIQSISSNESLNFKTTAVKYLIVMINRQAKQMVPNRKLKYLPQNILVSWLTIILSNNLSIFQSNPELLTNLIRLQNQLAQDLPLKQLENNQLDFNLILKNKDIFEIYLNQIKGNESLNIIVFLINYMSSMKLIDSHRETLVNFYNKVVLSSSTPLAIEIHQQFQSLFHSLQVDDFEKHLIPTISRLIKRSQDQIFHILVLILDNVRFDLDSLIKSQLMPLITPTFTSTTIPRAQIKKVFNILSKKIKDPKLSIAIINDDLLKPLTGPGSQPQKLNILSAINSFRHLIDQSDDKSISKSICNSVTTYLEKEFNKNNRIVGFKVLGNYMKYIDILSDAMIKLVQNSLKSDEDAVKAQTVRSLSWSLGGNNEKKLQQLNQFTETINNQLKNIKNPKTCDTAVASASLQFILNLSLTPMFSAKMLSDKTNSQLLYSQSSFIHQTGYLLRSSKKDKVIDLLVDLIQCQKQFPSLKQSDRSIYSSVVTLLCHSHWQVRKDVCPKVQKLHESNEKLSDLLFVELIQILNQQAKESNKEAFSYTSKVFKGILSKNLSADHYPALALYSSHPLLSDSCNWKGCMSRIQQKSETILQKHSQQIVQYLYQQGLLNRNNQDLQIAFQKSVCQLIRFQVPSLIEQIVYNLSRSLSLQPISQFTSLQWAIYNTPQDQIFQEKKDQVIQNKTDKKQPKKKTAEEQREEEIKKRQEEKKRKESGEAEKEEKERQKQLQTQQAIRKDINDAIRLLTLSMETVEKMVGSNPQFLGEFMSPVIQSLFLLLKNDITSQQSYKIYERLSLLIPSKSRLDRGFCGFYLNIVKNIFYTSDMSDIQILSATQRILNQLRDSVNKNGPFNGFTLNYFWPILKNSLEKSISFTLQEMAMDVIAQHTNQTQPYPRGSMIASLIVVVSSSTRLETIARNTIFQLINGVEISDISELMDGLISSHHQVRSICLQAIEKIPAIYAPDFQWEDRYQGNLWFVRFDTETTTSALAEKIWLGTNQKDLPEDSYLQCLRQSTFNQHSDVRKINALALKSVASLYPAHTKTVLEQLFERYQVAFPDEIKDTPALTLQRLSIATALSGLGNSISSDASLMTLLFEWIIHNGLFDPREDVVQEFITTGMNIISDQGKQFSQELLTIFETFLQRPDDETGAEDTIRANVAIFMGTLAKHMQATNPKLPVLIDKLVDTLSFPSRYVQESVAKCLTQLIPTFKSQGERLVPILLQKLKMGTDFSDRRGAAFGLAGTVKGLGISSLKNYDILNILQGYVEDKKHAFARQGALFAFECLCNVLGRVFEPYVIQILPKLLVCFGDNNADVRQACSKAARAIMSQLSGHGVKIVLPALLKALDDRQWRTKEGSIELLGAMAFCAPKQLSTCLPTIVPKLTYVLNDTHTKVQEAAKEALSHIGSVIRNPEIQIHVPLLLKTYDDPEIYSKELLENLLNTNYVHTIDPASLSLVMPILERTLKERSSELKKMSCQIIGNLCSLTEPKELIPYINSIMPVMKNVLLDQIPEVRAICSRAIGLLVKGIGEDNFTTLIPWLLETVKSDQGAVERSGAAQGLSEVLSALDISRFHSLLQEFLTMANSPRAHVREGIMSVFIFTPISLGDQFLPYLPKVLPQVLKGLADDSDPVREVCMRCGQSIVNRFAVTGIEVIVPSLEKVLFHENWRIRLSTVQLFGDLLFRLAGHSVNENDSNNTNTDDIKAQTEDDSSDEEESTQETNAKIYKLLGKERLDRILSSMYMMRFDNNSQVRQRVLLIWKFIVNNTPKTLREILPSLVEMIIASIGSSNFEKRQVSARALGDIVSKLTDRILPEILPILEKGLNSTEEETRQGVCIGLSEVISSARTYLLPFLSSVVNCISKALYDPLIDVREAAAKAFDHLYSSFGSKASNEILPNLIQLLDGQNKQSAYALDGIRQIILVKSSVVLPVLVPKLLAKPISSSNVKALASLAGDAGEGLYNHLTTIIPTMIQSFTDNTQDQTCCKDIKESAIQICKSVKSEEGLEILIPLLMEQTEVRLPNIRLGACELIGEFASSNTTTGFEDHIETMVVSLLALFTDPETSVQVASNLALASITKSVKKENLSYLSAVHQGIQALVNEVNSISGSSEPVLVPGFCIPKGLASVLPILINGLMYGTSDQRELATTTLFTCITYTTADGLKPFVMQITGPLILVIGDKFPWNVKSAILQTLSLLIQKCPLSMKIFLHQLQPTFIKALSDPHKLVRNNAATALGLLMTLSTSVDQLVNSLITGIATADSVSQEAKLRALQSIFDKKPKIDQANLDKAINAIIDFLYQPSDEQRFLVAQVIGASSKCFNQQDLNQFIKNHLISPSQSVLSRYGKSLALGEVFKSSGEQLIQQQSPHIPVIIQIVQADCKDDKGPIRESSAYLAEAILNTTAVNQYSKELIPSLCHLIQDQSSSVAITSLQIIKRFSKKHPALSKQYLTSIVPPTMNRLKERTNLPLKLAAERNLVHSLQIFKDSAVLEEYIASLSDQTLSQSITDYNKRILLKLSPDSDTEKI